MREHGQHMCPSREENTSECRITICTPNRPNPPSSSESGSWNVVQDTIERAKHTETVTGVVLSIWQASFRSHTKCGVMRRMRS
jgi:hypothetical protein